MTTFQIRVRESLKEKILSALDNQFTVTEQDIDMVAFALLTKLIINSQRKSKQKGLPFCPLLKRMVKYIFQVINQKTEAKLYIDHCPTDNSE